MKHAGKKSCERLRNASKESVLNARSWSVKKQIYSASKRKQRQDSRVKRMRSRELGCLQRRKSLRGRDARWKNRPIGSIRARR